MESICDRLQMDLELKNYSPHTRTCYLARVRDFALHFHQSPEDLGKEEIRAYLHYLIKEKRVSQSFISQAYSALKFFCETTLDRDWDGVRIPRMKKTRKLPVVLSRQEVWAILSVMKNLKHRAILATIYSGGLRVSEAVHLKVSDIDSSRMMIRIGHGKRGKDRYTILATHTLELLREYWRCYRPVDWLFPGKPPTRPISTKAVQRVFRKALPRAG